MSDDLKVTVAIKSQISEGKNKNYMFNKPPLLLNPLAKLPIGSIRPKGWLKQQIDLMVNGMTGRLTEISEFLKPDNGWFGGDKNGWEEQPYWFRGFYDLAVMSQNKRLLNESKRWIEAVINNQDKDGYFGAKHNKSIVGKNGQKLCDLWPHMIMLDAIISYYEYSSDPKVIPMMTRFFNFCRNLPEEEFIPPVNPDEFGNWMETVQGSRAGDMIPQIHWLYNQTGETWLLELATRVYRHITPPIDEWLDYHVVNFTQRFRYPATYYVQSGYVGHLLESEYWYSQHLSTWGQQPRGIFGADEQIRHGYTDPRQGFETCAMVEFNKSFYILGRITGETKYADRCEDIFLNHFPASQTPDMKALHYLTASNQPQLDNGVTHEYFNKCRQLSYSPYVIYRCCQHNVAMGWPWYVQNLWQATADSGLACWLYAPTEVGAKVGEDGADVNIDVRTNYPFEENIIMKFKISKPVKFPLYLRVPVWCQKFSVKINNQDLKITPQPGTYLRIERKWSDNDVISIEMPMEISLSVWPKTGSVTVNRGPLSYSVKIEERWQRCGGTDEWPEWEVFPTTAWNYGLIIDTNKPTATLRVVKKGIVAKQPWTIESAPVEIKAKAKKIPGWTLENDTVSTLQKSPIKSDEPEEEITLIPLGCARLRMGCLPVIGEGQSAQEWKK